MTTLPALDPGFDFITGGAGFIGSHLVDRLLSSGRRVRVLDNLSTGRLDNIQAPLQSGKAQFVEGDVADADLVSACMEGADRVFHLAARADIVPSIQQPDAYFRANVDGTFAVLEACRAHDIRRIVYIASSSCYGIPETYPTPETVPADPRSPYALTKYLGEQLAMHWAQVYKLPVLSLRFFNIYGPRARTTGTYGAVFGVFLAQLLAGKPLTIVGDGEQTRDFTFVSDAVDAILTAADSELSGRIYNVGSDRTVSVNRIVELLGAKDIIHIPKRPGEPDCTFADTSRIKKDLSWNAKVPIEDGIRILLENIDYWRNAPVWTTDKIAQATEDWFKYLK